jgi:hypothetical protein
MIQSLNVHLISPFDSRTAANKKAELYEAQLFYKLFLVGTAV